MNETKHNIEISGAIIEQLSSLNEEEPTKYWRAGLKLLRKSSGVLSIFTSERAAWIDRERCLSSGKYESDGTPYEVTRDEANAYAKSCKYHKVEVWDETGTVVDWWSVE